MTKASTKAQEEIFGLDALPHVSLQFHFLNKLRFFSDRQAKIAHAVNAQTNND